MYAGDSFFTLSALGQAGLVLLSLTLALVMIWLTWRLARERNWFLKVVIGAALYTAFLWLSPQIYYAYYLMIIPGLPLQIVIQNFPDLNEAARLLTFQTGASLSEHGRGVLGILMLVAAAAAGLDSRRDDPDQGGR